MKFYIIFGALLAFALASPVDHGVEDKVLSYESNANSKGYRFNFETSNGIRTDEFGHIDKGHGHGHSHGHSHDHDNKDDHEEHDANLHVHGSYAWVDEKTGAKFNIRYTADENGYQPEPYRFPKH